MDLPDSLRSPTRRLSTRVASVTAIRPNRARSEVNSAHTIPSTHAHHANGFGSLRVSSGMKTMIQWSSVVLFLAVASAHASPNDSAAQARQFFFAGGQAYDRARYQDAIRAFEQAYRLLPKSGIAFSLAQAYRRQYFVDRDRRKLQRALKLYRTYLKLVPEARRRADAVEQLQALTLLKAKLKKRKKNVTANAPDDIETAKPKTELMVYSQTEGARVRIDRQEPEDLPRLAEVSPGPHQIHVSAPGFRPEARTVLAVEGRFLPVEFTLQPKPGRLHLRAPHEAAVWIDEREQDLSSGDAKLSLAPGQHRIVVQQSGRYRFDRTLELKRDQELSLLVKLKTTTERRLAHYSFVASGGLLLLGTASALLAVHFQGQAQEITDLSIQGNITESDRASLNTSLSRRNVFRAGSVVLLSSALVAAGLGAFLYFTDTPGPEPGKTPLMPSVGISDQSHVHLGLSGSL